MASSEPRVVTESVRKVLERALSTFDADQGESVQMVAERAGTSTRTVYRVLGAPRRDQHGDPTTISLDLADRLVVAAGGTLSLDCEIVEVD